MVVKVVMMVIMMMMVMGDGTRRRLGSGRGTGRRAQATTASSLRSEDDIALFVLDSDVGGRWLGQPAIKHCDPLRGQ